MSSSRPTVAHTAAISNARSSKAASGVPSSAPVLIAVDLIDPHPANPRLAMSDATLDALVAQMADRGSFDPAHPIMVRLKSDGRYEVLSGATRVEAAKRAGLTEIWATVVTATDEAAYLALVLANTQEPLSFLEIAFHVLRLLAGDKGLSISRLAKLLGLKRENLSRYVKGARVFEALRAGLSEDDINRLRSKAEHLARVADAPTETWETLVRMLLDAEADGVTWTVRSTELALEELAGRSLTPMPPQDESDGPTVGPPESGPTLKGQPPKSTSKPPTPEKNEGDKTGSNKVVEVSLAIGGEPQRLPVDGKVVRARVTGIQITREVLKSLYLGSESEGITEEDGIISISVDELSAHRSPTITSGTVKIEVL